MAYVILMFLIFGAVAGLVLTFGSMAIYHGLLNLKQTDVEEYNHRIAAYPDKFFARFIKTETPASPEKQSRRSA